MILYFEHSNGERTEIGKPVSVMERDAIIAKFLKDHNYTAPYMRFWEENGETWIDVGSHTEFFISVEE